MKNNQLELNQLICILNRLANKNKWMETLSTFKNLRYYYLLLIYSYKNYLWIHLES